MMIKIQNSYCADKNVGERAHGHQNYSPKKSNCHNYSHTNEMEAFNDFIPRIPK